MTRSSHIPNLQYITTKKLCIVQKHTFINCKNIYMINYYDSFMYIYEQNPKCINFKYLINYVLQLHKFIDKSDYLIYILKINNNSLSTYNIKKKYYILNNYDFIIYLFNNKNELVLSNNFIDNLMKQIIKNNRIDYIDYLINKKMLVYKPRLLFSVDMFDKYFNYDYNLLLDLDTCGVMVDNKHDYDILIRLSILGKLYDNYEEYNWHFKKHNPKTTLLCIYSKCTTTYSKHIEYLNTLQK